MQKTQVWFLGQEDPLEEGNSNPAQYSCLGKPIAWWATVRGVTKESDMRVTKQKNQQSVMQCFLVSGRALILTGRSCVHSAAEESFETRKPKFPLRPQSVRRGWWQLQGQLQRALSSSSQGAFFSQQDDGNSCLISPVSPQELTSSRQRRPAQQGLSSSSWKGVCYHLWSNCLSE